MMRIQTLVEPMVVFAVNRNWPGARAAAPNATSSGWERTLGVHEAGEAEQLEEPAAVEAVAEDDPRIADPAFLPAQDPHLVHAAREPPDTAGRERDRAGVREPFTELAGDARERV